MELGFLSVFNLLPLIGALEVWYQFRGWIIQVSQLIGLSL